MFTRFLIGLSIPMIVFGCSRPAATPAVAPPKPSSAASSSGDADAKPQDSSAAAPADEPKDSTANSSAEAESSKGSPAAPDAPSDEEKKSAANVADLIAKARTAAGGEGDNPLQQGDLDTAIKLLEQALKQDPKSRQALSLSMFYTQLQGMSFAQQGIEGKAYPLFLKSGEYLRTIRAMGEPLSLREQRFSATVLYNEACSFAIDKKPDKAMESLKEAIEAGFNDTNQIDSDTDLISLRDRDDYKKLREQMKGK